MTDNQRRALVAIVTERHGISTRTLARVLGVRFESAHTVVSWLKRRRLVYPSDGSGILRATFEGRVASGIDCIGGDDDLLSESVLGECDW